MIHTVFLWVPLALSQVIRLEGQFLLNRILVGEQAKRSQLSFTTLLERSRSFLGVLGRI